MSFSDSDLNECDDISADSEPEDLQPVSSDSPVDFHPMETSTPSTQTTTTPAVSEDTPVSIRQNEGTFLTLLRESNTLLKSLESRLLRLKSWFLPKKILLMFYKSYILPTLDYCDTVWSSGCTATQALKLERLQNYACRIILKQPRIASAAQLRSILNLPTLKLRRDLHSVTQVPE